MIRKRVRQDEPLATRSKLVLTSKCVRGRYTPISLLGEGSFGEVWRMHDKVSNTYCALKLPTTDADEDDGLYCVDLREIALLRRLSDSDRHQHPNIIRLLNVMAPAVGEVSFSLEMMSSDVASFMQQQQREGEEAGLTEVLAAKITHQAAQGLRHLHGLRIMHRDIKPANLLISEKPELRVKLGDFGLAIYKEPGRCNSVTAGTRWFQAPEVLLESSDYGYPVDVWALGVTYATLRCGSLGIFQADDDKGQIKAIARMLGMPRQAALGLCPKFKQYVRAETAQLNAISSSSFELPPVLNAGEKAFLERLLRWDPTWRADVHAICRHFEEPPPPPTAATPLTPKTTHFTSVLRSSFRSSSSTATPPEPPPTAAPLTVAPPPAAPPQVPSPMSLAWYAPVDPRFLEGHKEIGASHRARVVNWAVDMFDDRGCSTEALHLACNLLDRYLASNQALRAARLPVLACASCLLASKLLDIDHLDMYTDTHAGGSSSSSLPPSEVREMEHELLIALDADLHSSTAATALGERLDLRIPRALSPEEISVALYLADLSLFEVSMAHHPDVVAQACIALACSPVLPFDSPEVSSCAAHLRALHLRVRRRGLKRKKTPTSLHDLPTFGLQIKHEGCEELDLS